MRCSRLLVVASLTVASLVGRPSVAGAQFYQQHNLFSDVPGLADKVDPDLVNGWGLVASATSPWWVADNASNKSTLYNTSSGNPPTKLGLVVSVPGNPTGVVNYGGTGFVVTSGAVHGPSRFIFATEAGTILGWPGNPATVAVVGVPAANGAVYKGLAIAGDVLYATNFHNGTVDVFDKNFSPIKPGDPGNAGFADPSLPSGYAPFGIRNLSGLIYVTYALQDQDAHDDVPGEGHGFVNVFDTSGNLLGRVASKGQLNSPWGLAFAPDKFGKFSGDLLVGNFGNGRIHAFDPQRTTGQGEFQHRGPLHSADGPPLEIDGLWALAFGNNAAAGPSTTLFFTAGPFDEGHGLFGSIVAVGPPGQDR